MMELTDYNTSDWPAQPPLAALVNRVHHADALTLLRAMPDNSVDLLLTDPPYMTTITSLTKKTPAYAQLMTDRWVLPIEWISEAVRVMKRGAAFYIFCGTDEMSFLIRELKSCNCKITNTLVWLKTNPLPSFTKKTYRGAVEIAIYGCKESFGYFVDCKQQDLMPYWFEPIVQGEVRTIHPTQKPLRIIKQWVLNSCPPNGVVLDPFGGSGTTAIAAREQGFNYITCDVSAEYCDLMRHRLSLPYTPNMFTTLQEASA